jgi:ribosomal protein S18 acetylase RimI-like enzyme
MTVTDPVTKSLQIRPGQPADAEPLSILAAQSFRDAFAAENTADDLDGYIRESFSTARIHSELLDRSNTFLLAFAQASLTTVGYAKLRRGKADLSVKGPEPIELHRLYVHSSAIGCGVGAALMRASLDAARAGGCQTLWLGVWEHNTRAIEFYKRWGLEVVGGHPFQLGADLQTDLIMMRSVGDTP